MSKKNIIISVVLLVVIALLLFIYQSDFLFEEAADHRSEAPITSTEENAGELSMTSSSETASSETKQISDEACIEITAYALRVVESGLNEVAKLSDYGHKIEELEKKYGVDSESDYFNEYCSDRFLEEDVAEKLKEKMRELGSDIE
jgi:hypothetical protein